MYVRLIHAVDDNGNEYVYFTEDFDSKPEDFLRPGYKAYFDKKIHADLPDCFPLDCELQKI